MFLNAISEIQLRGDHRTAVIRDLRTRKTRTHGLGVVGEPLRPYLDGRGEGYLLQIDPAALPPVREILYKETPLKSGKYPTRRRPWSALGAPDVVDPKGR